MTITMISINGMHCASCETLLAEVLEDLDGVTTATVSYKNGSAVVTHDANVTEATLRKAIEAEGYTTA